MTTTRALSLIFGATAFLSPVIQATSADFEIHSIPRQTDRATRNASAGNASETTEHWVYDLTIENKTFQQVDNLEVKYVIFLTKEQLGKVGATSQRQEGSLSVASLRPHEKKTISTDPVLLAKRNLVGNYHYTDGAKPNANDGLVGIALRIMQNGQQLTEFANPTTLLKEKWE